MLCILTCNTIYVMMRVWNESKIKCFEKNYFIRYYRSFSSRRLWRFLVMVIEIHSDELDHYKRRPLYITRLTRINVLVMTRHYFWFFFGNSISTHVRQNSKKIISESLFLVKKKKKKTSALRCVCGRAVVTYTFADRRVRVARAYCTRGKRV